MGSGGRGREGENVGGDGGGDKGGDGGESAGGRIKECTGVEGRGGGGGREGENVRGIAPELGGDGGPSKRSGGGRGSGDGGGAGKGREDQRGRLVQGVGGERRGGEGGGVELGGGGGGEDVLSVMGGAADGSSEGDTVRLSDSNGGGERRTFPKLICASFRLGWVAWLSLLRPVCPASFSWSRVRCHRLGRRR